jgi:hypothetical protein
MRAVTDPCANLVHVGLRRKISKSGETRARNKNLQEKMLKEGPASLSPSDRVYLLRDAESTALHHGVRQMNNANFVIQRAPAEALQKSDIENPTIRAADRSSAAVHWQQSEDEFLEKSTVRPSMSSTRSSSWSTLPTVTLTSRKGVRENCYGRSSRRSDENSHVVARRKVAR